MSCGFSSSRSSSGMASACSARPAPPSRSASSAAGPSATSLGVEVRGGSVTAEGELDFRGTLAIDKDVPVGFRAIRIRFDLDTDASEEDLATLLRLTERYCVVLQTIAGAPQLRVEASATS